MNKLHIVYFEGADKQYKFEEKNATKNNTILFSFALDTFSAQNRKINNNKLYQNTYNATKFHQATEK